MYIFNNYFLDMTFSPVVVWSDWSMWSDGCSGTCGKGVRVRERVCAKGHQIDKGRCEGNRTEVERCFGGNHTCPGKLYLLKNIVFHRYVKIIEILYK